MGKRRTEEEAVIETVEVKKKKKHHEPSVETEMVETQKKEKPHEPLIKTEKVETQKKKKSQEPPVEAEMETQKNKKHKEPQVETEEAEESVIVAGDENGVETGVPAGTRMVDFDYEDKLRFTSVIAKPMASRKLTKRVLKLVRKASSKKSLITGLKNVQKAIRKGEKFITVIAGDVTPIDVISHMPVFCEDNQVPYIFVPLRYDISAAMGVKRPCVMLMVKPQEKYEKLYEEIKSTLELISNGDHVE